MSVPFLVRCFSLCVLYLLSYKGRMARFSKGGGDPTQDSFKAQIYAVVAKQQNAGAEN